MTFYHGQESNIIVHSMQNITLTSYGEEGEENLPRVLLDTKPFPELFEIGTVFNVAENQLEYDFEFIAKEGNDKDIVGSASS